MVIWAWSLDSAPIVRAQLYNLLSPEERARAGRLRRSVDADRFVVAHGRLRQLWGLQDLALGPVGVGAGGVEDCQADPSQTAA